MTEFSFEDWFNASPVSLLEAVEDVYINNAVNPTGTFSTVIRPYMALHPISVQIQD